MFTSKSFKDPKRPHIALTHLNPYLSENMMSISSDFNNFVLYLTQCHINSLNNGYNIINLYTDALAPLSNDNLSINKNKIKNSNLVYKSWGNDDVITKNSGYMYTFWTRYTLVNDLYVPLTLNDDTLLFNNKAINNMNNYDIYKYLNVINHSKYRDIVSQENLFVFELTYNKELWEEIHFIYLKYNYKTNLHEALIEFIS